MTVFRIINDLNRKGIELKEADGQLKISAPKGALTAELREQLATNKSEIIAFLRDVEQNKTRPTIEPVNRYASDGDRTANFPLSYAQERLWFIDQMDPGSANYNIPGAVVIEGAVHLSEIQLVFEQIIQRHESLRTVFRQCNGEAQQRVLSSINSEIPWVDLSHLSESNRLNEAKAICNTEAATVFDLSTGPLIRGKLLKLAEQQHVLSLTMHHIISDGWSVGIFIGEFRQILQNLKQGLIQKEGFTQKQKVSLKSLDIQYVDFAVWQKELLEGGSIGPGGKSILEQQLSYWQKKLANLPESLDLATDYPRPARPSYEGAGCPVFIDSDVTNQLKKLSEQQGCSLFMTLLAILNVLLYRYSGQQDICLGSPIANRQSGETEALIGMFVNTLALRNKISADASFTHVLAQVKNTCLEAYEHQDCPFEKIVESLLSGRNYSLNPLFQIMFNLQASSVEPVSQSDGPDDLSFRPFEFKNSVAKFDLTFALNETNNGLVGAIEYRTCLYQQQTIKNMVRHFVSLCRTVVANPDTEIGKLRFVEEPEQQQLLYANNKTVSRQYSGKSVNQLFVEQVDKFAQKTAVACEQNSLSYQTLFNKSSELALYLQSLGVRPETKVGLCVEKSTDMIVAIMGILQAGGAWVPLDPDYPEERLAFMLADAEVNILLTQNALKDRLSFLRTENLNVLEVDKLWQQVADKAAALRAQGIALQRETKPQHLAYVIYTSGSTGKPKGVEVEHAGLVAFLSQPHYVDISKVDKVASMSSFAFDGFIFDLFLPLLSGATLHLYRSQDCLEPELLQRKLKRDEIDTFFVTTALFNHLVENNSLENTAVKQVLFGGEQCDLSAVKKAQQQYPDINLINVYGPTETIVFATCYWFTAEKIAEQCAFAPIGKAINNNQLLVLDERLQLVPCGAIGELYIGGDSLARGYLNRPKLTAEKFIANPYHNANISGCPARLYRSGDLVRVLHDGNLDFIGRADGQVKIRGFRIELGEIQTLLKKHTDIKDCVVIAQGEKDTKKLVAFCVASEESNNNKDNLNQVSLSNYLQKTLPDYMIPAAFAAVEALPLTSNGKVDRRQLENMEVDVASSIVYQAPGNVLEKQLVDIWAELLGLNPGMIGVNDNFFELGGHSLLAIKICTQIENKHNIAVKVRQLFEHPTVAALGKLMATLQEEASPDSATKNLIRLKANPTPLKAVEVPLSPNHIYALENSCEKSRNSWYMKETVNYQQPLQEDKFRLAIRALYQRHDALRLSFFQDEAQIWKSCILPFDLALLEADKLFEVIDITEMTSEEVAEARANLADKFSSHANLTVGPMLHSVYVIDQQKQLYQVIHSLQHHVADQLSFNIMLAELEEFYQGYVNNTIATLPPVEISWYSYAHYLQDYCRTESCLSRQDYWLPMLKEKAAAITDVTLPEDAIWHDTSYTGKLSTEVTANLVALTHRSCRYRMFDLVLESFLNAWSEWKQDDLLRLNLILNGREVSQVNADASNLVGWVSELLPVCIKKYPTDTRQRSLDSVVEQLKQIPEDKSIGLLRYCHPDQEVREQFSDIEEPPINFNYIGESSDQSSNVTAGDSDGSGNKVTQHGPPLRKHYLIVQIYMINQCLHVSWDYVVELFTEEEIKKLNNLFINQLFLLSDEVDSKKLN